MEGDEFEAPEGSQHLSENHPWYDDEFCKGGDAFVGVGEPQVPCPVCGELMDVDARGCLFKHRPRIPKSPG